MSPLNAELDRVRALLSEAQDILPGFSDESRQRLAAEMQRAASILDEAIKSQNSRKRGIHAVPAETQPQYGDVERAATPWLERALNEARMGAWQWDLVTGQIQWSRGMYELYGVDPQAGPIGHDEFIGMMSAEDQQRVRNEFAEAAERNGLFSHEFRFTRPDGRLIWVHSAGAVEADDHGTVIRIGGVNQDITDRKAAEAALHDSQKRIAQLVETSFEGIWSVDENGITTFVNLRAAEILGYTVEEIQGEDAFKFLMASDAEAGRATLERIARGESGRVEAHARNKDGEEVWLLVSFSPLQSQQGEFRGALAMFTDITERKQIEDTLTRTAQELQQAQRLAHVGSWNWQPATDEVTGSEDLYRIFGLQPGRDRLPRFKDQRGTLFPEDVWDQLNEAVQETLRSGAGYALDLPALRGGEPIWITARSEPVFDSQGSLIGLRGTIQDITERKRAEEALRESEARFHASIESLPQSFVIYSAVREPGAEAGTGKATDLRFEYVNEAACRLGRLSRRQMIGHTLGELPPEHPLRGLMQRYLEVVETGESLVEAGYRFRDAGEPGPDQEKVHYVRASKLGDGLVVVRDDVTQQVRLENERRDVITRLEIQQRLVEQSERERQAFAREIHDGPIQTLAALGLNISFIEDAFPDPALRVELEQIGLAVKTAGRELRQVINEMRPPSPLRLGLSKAIEYHGQGLRERAPQIQWELQLAPDPGTLTEPARLALFRIFQEATTNIMRHSHADRAWVRFQVRRNAVALEIRDNGRGMDLDQEVEGHHGEYHFGLTGMRERAEAIGAQLEIESRPGAGTRVRATLPVTREG